MSHWKVKKSEDIIKTGFFRLRKDECELPDGRINPHYYVFDFTEWVNIVPVTADGQMIMVEQYRHGGGDVFLEVPGGTCDKRGEDPNLAGQRELREETGYVPGEWLLAGTHYPNPALQSNRLHTYLALGCTRQGDPELDPFEDLVVKLLPIKDVYRMVEEGKIKHSLIIASLMLSKPLLRARGLL